MMTRRPRIIIPGWVHNVTQRGNHRQTVFFDARDRIVYLRLVEKYFPKYDIRLIGYNLMSNHIHLAAIPEKESSFSYGIGQLHHDFALWQNIQCNRDGHLWQNRFFSSPVEEVSVWEVLSYIELNPVRARMVEHAWDWEWSSARAHVTGHDSSGLLDMTLWQRSFNAMGWKEYLEKMAAEEAVVRKIRRATVMGHFLGSESTALKLEKELKKQLLPKKRGRKSR